MTTFRHPPKILPKDAMTQALDDITIIDLTHVLAGPYCTMMLADLGAEVIKVEPPGTGDDSRHFGPFIPERDNPEKKQSGYFISINRNKKSICVDLKTGAGKVILRDMIRRGDVVVENFRPGTMEKLGFSYEEMKAVNPGIIYCSISGFGHDTVPEQAGKPAYDMVAQGYSGLMSVTGPEGGPPVRVGSSVGDIVAGHQAAFGILAALRYRDRTGTGQHIDIAMVDGLVAVLENAIVRHTIDKEVPEPLGTAHPAITPFQGFKTADGSWIITPIGNDSLWAKFCTILGREDLIYHGLYISNGLRTENKASLIPVLEGELMKKPSAEWISLMEAAGLPCSPLNTVDKVVTDKNLLYRSMIIKVDQTRVGEITMAGSPCRMSETPGTVRNPAPLLGEHTEEVLADFLEYDREAVEYLLHEQVVYTAE